jgi:hypothetical protein
MSKNHVPQGLKPVCAADLGGTAKAVPFRVSLKQILKLMLIASGTQGLKPRIFPCRYGPTKVVP